MGHRPRPETDESPRVWWDVETSVECAREDCGNKVSPDRVADFNPYCSDECESEDLIDVMHTEGFLDDPDADEQEEDEDETPSDTVEADQSSDDTRS